MKWVTRSGLFESDLALLLLARIANGADADNSLWTQAESWGLRAIAEGFRPLGLRDDREINRTEWVVFDALHADCQKRVSKRQGTGAFREVS